MPTAAAVAAAAVTAKITAMDAVLQVSCSNVCILNVDNF